MAIFGFQLCFTLIMASFLQKLSPLYSFGRWLLCGGEIVHYKAPADRDLRKASGKREHKIKGQKNNSENLKTFKVAKTLDFNLESEKLNHFHVMLLRSYSDYEWVLNYMVCALLVYIGTEIYYSVWNPTNDFNLSMIWIGLSAWFSVRNLLSILWLYAKSKAGGELSMSVAFSMVSFIISLAVLMMRRGVFDFTLQHDVTTNITVLDQSLFSSRLQLSLAVCSAFIGLLFIFPAIRLAQMYVDASKYCSGITQFALHLNFFAPALISLLWIKPLLEALSQDPRSGGIFVERAELEILRIILVLLAVILRIALTRHHIQAYLNLAYDKVLRLRKESGTITNVDLQNIVSQVYYYLGVVAVQYVSPAVLFLCFALFLKTYGGYSWLEVNRKYKAPRDGATSRSYIGDELIRELTGSIEAKWTSATSIFTPSLLREISSYTLWWSATNWFAASFVGLFYHHYLAG